MVETQLCKLPGTSDALCIIHTYYVRVDKALRSAGGFRRPLRATLTPHKKEESNKMRMNVKRTERRFMVLGLNCRLANAKNSMVHENNPDAACMDEIRRKDGENEEQSV